MSVFVDQVFPVRRNEGADFFQRKVASFKITFQSDKRRITLICAVIPRRHGPALSQPTGQGL